MKRMPYSVEALYRLYDSVHFRCEIVMDIMFTCKKPCMRCMHSISIWLILLPHFVVIDVTLDIYSVQILVWVHTCSQRVCNIETSEIGENWILKFYIGLYKMWRMVDKCSNYWKHGQWYCGKRTVCGFYPPIQLHMFCCKFMRTSTEPKYSTNNNRRIIDMKFGEMKIKI